MGALEDRLNSLLKLLIYETLKDQGYDDMRACERIARVIENDVPELSRLLERQERDKKIYELRADETEETLAIRFHRSTRQIRRIVREQHEKAINTRMMDKDDEDDDASSPSGEPAF